MKIARHSPFLRPILSSRRTIIVNSDAKGFGTSKNVRKVRQAEEDASGTAAAGHERRVKSKGRQQRRPPGRGTAPPSQFPSPSTLETMQDGDSLTDQLEFEARLKALESATERQQGDGPVQTQANGPASILDSPNYDNPPPLSETFFSNRSKNDKFTISGRSMDENEGSFGSSQVGLAVASLALVGVFVLTSGGGGDIGYAPRQAAEGTSIEMAAEQVEDIKNQLARLEGELKSDPDNTDSLEAAAVLHARLGEYSDAISLLKKLQQFKTEDVDVLRVLAETQLAAELIDDSVATYREAWGLSGKSSLEILTGFTTALAAKGEPAAAIREIQNSAVAATTASATNRDVSGTTKSTTAPDFGPIELGLLEAKVYSGWKGHAADAFAKYDELMNVYSEDFRPPLGKALLLRRQGREGDAQRYFIQAKYLAPKESRAAVDAFAAATN